MADPLVNLAVVGPYQNLFTYKLHAHDSGLLQPGCRFLVPFGKSHKVAFFVGFQNDPVDYQLKYVKERIDPVSPFPPYLFEFCRWVSEYYFAGLGETLAAALPGAGARRPKIEYLLTDKEFFENIQTEQGISHTLAKALIRRGALKEETIRKDKEAAAVIRRWLEAGVITPRYRVKTTRKKLLGYRRKGMSQDPVMLSSRGPAEAGPWRSQGLHGREIETATSSRNGGPPDQQAERIQPDITYSRAQLLKEMGISAYQVDKLIKNGVIEKVFDESGVTELTNYPIRRELPNLPLLDGQKQVLDEILPAIDKNTFVPFLLFGITGSGKTLIYCHAARRAVDAGGSVLVMVPEIALSGLLLSSFAAFFGDDVAVIHSGMSPADRLIVRDKIASGEIRVVIGPRSAIFSPLKNPRLIIVDEEHDPSYKQDDPAPRYHARDAAVMLARTAGCPIVLGSASPAVESYHNAVMGRYRLLTLDQRPISGYRMPAIEMLDMKSEKILGDCSFLSFRLKRETEKRIARGEQIIYYLNRRGFSPRLKCGDCGEVPTCPDCGVTLTYHKTGRQLKCHFCDRIEPAPDKCPRCQSADFLYIGAGTQRVEETLARLFADVKAVRIDSDRTAARSGRLILGDFAEEKYNLLVGTQMVTKGLDFPNVTLVGVLSADIGLDMPDFRAAEKTYARLLQVAGRAGRGDKEGLVIIQTYYTGHPVIKYLREGNYPLFYDAVVEERRELFYPPFSRLINITLSCPDEKLLEKHSLEFRIRLEEKLSGLDGSSSSSTKSDGYPRGSDSDRAKEGPLPRTRASASERGEKGPRPRLFQMLGPAPAPMYKLRGHYRRRLIIKTTSVRKVVARLRAWEQESKSFALPSKVKVVVDVDAVDMM